MNKSDVKEFSYLMGKLALAFRTEISQAHVALYFERLEGCTMYQVRRAMNELMDTADRFPYASLVLKLSKSFKREPTPQMSEAIQIEEVTAPADAPRNKEDFFKAMKELTNKFDDDSNFI